MWKRLTSALAIVVALAPTSPACAADEGKSQARPPEGLRGNRVNIAGSERFYSKGDEEIQHLLISRAVQREIRLTDEQAEKIDETMRREGRESNDVLFQHRNERDPNKRAETWTHLTAMVDRTADHIKAVLERSQLQRLNEIVVQNMGLRSVLMPDVAAAMRLTPHQRSALKQILPPLHPMDVSWDRLTIEVERARPEVLRLLTKDQAEILRQVGGKPFDPEMHRAEDRENRLRP